VSIELRNYSRHGDAELEWLRDEVVGHRSLVEALAFVKRASGGPAVPAVVTQDEYTHDVTLRVRDDLYLAYGMT
jgi:hypothetical protein